MTTWSRKQRGHPSQRKRRSEYRAWKDKGSFSVEGQEGLEQTGYIRQSLTHAACRTVSKMCLAGTRKSSRHRRASPL